MSVQQYPYTLKVFQESESVFDQSTGNWVPGTAEWVDLGKCRDEINGGGARVTTQDGENYVYSAVVYMPVTTPIIPTGATVQVWDGDYKRMEGKVVRFGKEQLHSRLWV